MKAGAKTTEKDFDNLITFIEKYCDGARIKITIDKNPSPEKIAYIKERIKLSESRSQKGRVVELVDTLGLSLSGQ